MGSSLTIIFILSRHALTFRSRVSVSPPWYSYRPGLFVPSLSPPVARITTVTRSIVKAMNTRKKVLLSLNKSTPIVLQLIVFTQTFYFRKATLLPLPGRWP